MTLKVPIFREIAGVEKYSISVGEVLEWGIEPRTLASRDPTHPDGIHTGSTSVADWFSHQDVRLRPPRDKVDH